MAKKQAKKEQTSINAPEKLSAEAQAIWARVISGWQLDDAALVLLALGLEAHDEMRSAQQILERDGLIVNDRFGVSKQHPAYLILRDSRNAMLKCFRQLSLDIDSIIMEN
jgi:P27 family predicted phage terminase small subunit